MGEGGSWFTTPKVLCSQSAYITNKFIVQSGVNGLLDVARQNFKEVTADVFTLVEAYRSIPLHISFSDLGQFDLPIDLKFEEHRGYYLVTRKTELEKRQLPSLFTNVSPQGGKLHYDSLDLCKKNAKLRHSLNEIYVLSFETVNQLVEDVRVFIGCLYKVCEAIALLDMA